MSHNGQPSSYMKPMIGKSRLDQVLVDRGLAPTRSQARDLVKRGCVRVDGAAATKAGLAVDAAAAVEVEDGAQPYVSRGGLKLAAALAAFGFEARGLTALDIGASTGGFTHVLLDQGAQRVYAIDVGRGQLHPAIAGDARVVALEGQDVRALDATMISEPPQAIVADVSFISLTQALPAAMALAAPSAWLVALIKPQFEAGRAEIGKGGVVRDEGSRAKAVEKVRLWLGGMPGWRVAGVVPSPISGGAGNIEFLIGARLDG
jgi:23S rRNA (cytidine1920-2'-O)/16S rRNA (cytidine1409-2'-O)-methyltransferase